MKSKHQVHNLIILDESASMQCIKSTIIKGFNELVQTIKGIEKQFPNQEHFISFLTFNSLGLKYLHYNDPVNKLKQIDEKSYEPNASTPLLDAMGSGINKLKHYLQGQKDYNVLVTILTDGEENSSREYTGAAIKKLVEELKQNSWTFTYIGTEHDIEKTAFSLSINNILVFNKNEEDIEDMFKIERFARMNYSQKINLDEVANSSYFDDIDLEK